MLCEINKIIPYKQRMNQEINNCLFYRNPL